MAISSPRSPRLSVILPTDTWATIRPVVERLERQTIAGWIEVVIVTPEPEALAHALAGRPTISHWRTVRVPALAPLARARAAGVQAAQAQAQPAAPAADPNAELQNLANLHAQGVLTDEEFAAAKAKLLGI